MDASLAPQDAERFERLAISRMYYAVFHRAREWARSNGYIHQPGESAHRHLWNWLATKTDIPAFFERGYDVGHEDRKAADYELVTFQGFHDAWTNLTKLKELVGALPKQHPDDEVLQDAEKHRLESEVSRLWPMA